MDVVDFARKVNSPLKNVVNGFNESRTFSAYADLRALHRTFEDVRSQHAKIHALNPIEKGLAAEGIALTELSLQVDVQQRAMVVFGEVVVNVVLHEVLGRPAREVTVGRFVRDHGHKAAKLDSGALLGAHRLYVNRNKILIHQDVQRLGGRMISATGAVRHLPTPLPQSASVPSQILIEAMQKKYASIPEIQRETNMWRILEALFHHVPVLQGTQAHADRKVVDAWVEHGGVRGFTGEEVIGAVDAFTMAVVRAAPL